MDALRLLVILVIIILAVRRQFSVGVTLTIAGLVTALLYAIPLTQLLETYRNVVVSPRFISITAVIVLVSTLGDLLRRMGSLDNLSQACRRLPGGNRTAVVALPMLIGLMPMPGGALLSAPLVDSVLKDGHDGSFKAIVNYWFRHIVEFCWPIYPGIILSAAITHLSIGTIALLQLPFTLAMAAIGFVIFVRKISTTSREPSDIFSAIRGIALTLWPIAAAVLVYSLAGVDMAIAVALAILLLVVVTRPARSILIPAIKAGLSYKLLLMAFGVLSFQSILELSGAIQSLPAIADRLHLPDIALIFIVCFTIGLLTGMIAAFVGLGYVLLANVLYQPTVIPENILVAYFSGFLGMILSPTHLCLVLSMEYFKKPLLEGYKKLLLPLVILLLASAIVIFSAWPRLVAG